MPSRFVVPQAGDTEPVLRRVPAAAAQLGEGQESEEQGLEGCKMLWGIRGLGDGYEVILGSRGLSGGCRVGDCELGWGHGRARRH